MKNEEFKKAFASLHLAIDALREVSKTKINSENYDDIKARIDTYGKCFQKLESNTLTPGQQSQFLGIKNKSSLEVKNLIVKLTRSIETFEQEKSNGLENDRRLRACSHSALSEDADDFEYEEEFKTNDDRVVDELVSVIPFSGMNDLDLDHSLLPTFMVSPRHDEISSRRRSASATSSSANILLSPGGSSNLFLQSNGVNADHLPLPTRMASPRHDEISSRRRSVSETSPLADILPPPPGVSSNLFLQILLDWRFQVFCSALLLAGTGGLAISAFGIGSIAISLAATTGFKVAATVGAAGLISSAVGYFFKQSPPPAEVDAAPVDTLCCI